MAKKKEVSAVVQRNRMSDVNGQIRIERLWDAVLKIPIVGLTPIIPHRWSEKAKRSMPGHPAKETQKGSKEPRKPKEEAEASLYTLNGSFAYPATGFKAAIIGACRFFNNITMTEAKQLIFVEGEGPEQLVRIKGKKELREDMVRIAMGTADLRYRYCIYDWSAVLSVRFVAVTISTESVLNLVDAAGRGGIGDWRPSSPKSCTGTYGTWRVDDEEFNK